MSTFSHVVITQNATGHDVTSFSSFGDARVYAEKFTREHQTRCVILAVAAVCDFKEVSFNRVESIGGAL